MSIPEFFEACKNFDWFYAMSDDHRVWQRGEAAHAKLQAECAGPIMKAIYTAWSDYVQSGPAFGTEKKKRPELTDFLQP